jgi:hypothetical protein
MRQVILFCDNAGADTVAKLATPTPATPAWRINERRSMESLQLNVVNDYTKFEGKYFLFYDAMKRNTQ